MPSNRRAEQERRLRSFLHSKGLRPGDRIPSERDLADALGLGRTALRPLLAALEAGGILERRPQSGTFLRTIPAPYVDQATIALIAPFRGTGEPGRQTDPLWLYRVVSAFERVAISSRARLLLKDQTPSADSPCSIKSYVRAALTERVQAIVLLHPMGTREQVAHALALIHDAGVHPVIISSRTYSGLASQVYFDSEWGSYRATRYLLDQGHRRIGFAGAPEGHEWVQDRLRGYRNALNAAEVMLDPSWVWLPPEPGSERLAVADDGALAMDHFLSLPDALRPTAVVAANDGIALGLLQCAREAGIEVPAQLSVIGFDNDPGALLAGLTTVERPTETVGEVAARTTLDRIAAGATADTVTHRLRPVIIERSTVAAPSSASEE